MSQAEVALQRIHVFYGKLVRSPMSLSVSEHMSDGVHGENTHTPPPTIQDNQSIKTSFN